MAAKKAWPGCSASRASITWRTVARLALMVLTLLFLIFGIIAGYRNMFREMGRIQRKEAEADAPGADEKD